MTDLYKVKLENFEGPLDLLLFFVRKDELNIYDIPIAHITKSYLEYLQMMKDLNLDIAAEFILMAATLMRIKVRMMLPVDPVPEEEEDMMDPREELSRRLIEYRQFKEASKSLAELDEYWRQVYRRTYFNFDLIPKNEEEVYGLKDISFFDLLAAYKKAVERRPKPVYHSVERLNVTVEEQQKFMMDFFGTRTCFLFTEMCDAMVKVEIVVTFLAMLELVKQGKIAVKQATIFEDIWIYKASEFKEDEIPAEEKAVSEIVHPSGVETIEDSEKSSDPPVDKAPVPSDESALEVNSVTTEEEAEIAGQSSTAETDITDTKANESPIEEVAAISKQEEELPQVESPAGEIPSDSAENASIEQENRDVDSSDIVAENKDSRDESDFGFDEPKIEGTIQDRTDAQPDESGEVGRTKESTAFEAEPGQPADEEPESERDEESRESTDVFATGSENVVIEDHVSEPSVTDGEAISEQVEDHPRESSGQSDVQIMETRPVGSEDLTPAAPVKIESAVENGERVPERENQPKRGSFFGGLLRKIVSFVKGFFRR